jgi:lipid II:glycine glycyltransferase (peptidoglycan interpeptide bridge formation enzyme)
MIVVPLAAKDSSEWNAFVVTNFPPVGAFLQSFEWGEFKSALHGKVFRFAVQEGDKWIGCFQLETHMLPLGLSYGYAPRGPVLRKDLQTDAAKIEEVFSNIAEYLKKNFAHLIFVRFEPPLTEAFSFYNVAPFTQSSYYLQPRFNQLVTLAPSDKLIETFSNDVKHDIRAAGRLGITVSVTPQLSESEDAAFTEMKNDTGARSGKNIFPSGEYFTNLKKLFQIPPTTDPTVPRLCYFIASNKDGQPVALNMNLLYGDTLTYLYGASYSGNKSKRAPAYLHWKSMEYATENGFKFYDLGGVDDTMWQGLTYFKRQFGGTTMEYVGNVDVPLQPFFYLIYNFINDRKMT